MSETSGAKFGQRVTVHYTGRLSDGSVFDTTGGRPPLEVVIGAGELIDGFEHALVGMRPGESKTCVVPADEAYGSYNHKLVSEVGLDMLPEGMRPQPGQKLQLRADDGDTLDVVVAAVTGDRVKLDGNHPLAGKELHFDIRLVDILSEEE